MIVGRAITIMRAIQKRICESINKPDKKKEAKKKATIFAIAKLEELNGEQ